jgi:DNA-binding LacI/PurR family transcriptional regulator
MTIRQPVTIKQVAQQAGVSTQTVSRVLNDSPNVAPATRQRVQQVIERLEFRPSAIARSLIRRRSHTLGVVIAGLRYIGPSQTLNGITNQAEAMGYSLMLKKLPQFNTGDVEPILNALLARQVDGMIWAVPEVDNNRDWLLDRLPQLPVPMIFLTMRQQAGLSVVAVDNYAGGRLATEHLLDQGYRRIGHVAGPLAWWEARQRQAGWKDALTEAGLPPDDKRWAEGNWSSESGKGAISQLLDQYPEMDAVFVANDQMALSVLYIAARRGLRVPQDLAVVGFDGLPEGAYFYPSLTTVAQNLQEMGATAVHQVVQTIEGQLQESKQMKDSGVTWIKPRLIVRESSAYPD